MIYRKEIDGLRAIAVLPVLFFHAGFQEFEGGFVGVDVFFVISGYLITTIICIDISQDKFSIITFYERRCRRILPPLIAVIIFTLPFCFLWIPPKELKDYFQSVAAITLFSSNFLFWAESGYFQTEAELKPLLHTWSLAVEEQYYVLFPLLLIGLWHFQKRWVFAIIIALGLISLLIAEWWTAIDPSAGFFLLPSRAWELMIGSCTAFILLYGGANWNAFANNKVVGEIFGLAGLTLIAYAVFQFDHTIPFPSLYALVPTMGTALVILFVHSGTSAGTLLGSRPLVFIGLISYSAYLWHQPLFALARYRAIVEPEPTIYLLLTVLSLLLAFVSWRYIERPFRNRQAIGRPAIFTMAVTGSTLLFAVGVSGHFARGFDQRVGSTGELLTKIEQKLEINYGLSKHCNGGQVIQPECWTSSEPEILIWGDSYAMHLVSGLLASNPSAKIVQMTKSACGPFFEIAPISNKYSISWAKECLKFNEGVRSFLRSQNSVKYIVVSSQFLLYLGDNSRIYIDGKEHPADFELILNQFLATLDELSALGFQPIVFSPPPNQDWDIGHCLFKASYLANSLDVCNFSNDHTSGPKEMALDLLRQVSKRYPVVWIDKLICKETKCMAHFGDTFLFRDIGHLSKEGSALLGLRADFYRLITRDKQMN